MRTLLLTAVAMLVVTTAQAQTPAAKKKPTANAAKPTAPQSAEAAVRAASAAYVAALNAGDLKTAASYWAPDGEFVDAAGQITPAKTILAERLPKRLSGSDRPQLKVEIRSVRVINTETATEDGSLQVESPGQSTSEHSDYSSIWVNKQGKWQIHNLRELSLLGAATASEPDLKKLEWLLGRWSAKDAGQDVSVDCTWSTDRGWLLRDITIEEDGEVKQRISQRIGRDPLSPRIKSWAFDAEGGQTEAIWESSGDTWIVVSHGATPDGQQVSAKNTYSEISDAGFTFISQDARSGNDSLPNLKLRFSRSGTAERSIAAGDKTERDQILNSPEWREAERAYHEYLSVQKVYSPEEVERMKAETAARVAEMSAEELRDFLDDARDKLAVLRSKQADEARAWLAQRMAVEVKMTPEKVKQMRPDIARMTSSQLEQWLQQWETERQQVRQTQQAFDAGRSTQVQNIEAGKKRAAAEREAALNRAYAPTYSPYGTYYGVGPSNAPRRAPYYGGWRY